MPTMHWTGENPIRTDTGRQPPPKCKTRWAIAWKAWADRYGRYLAADTDISKNSAIHDISTDTYRTEASHWEPTPTVRVYALWLVSFSSTKVAGGFQAEFLEICKR